MGARTPPRFDLVGGRLCLDFCNTHGSRSGAPEERFPSYPDVVGWGWRAGVLNAEGTELTGTWTQGAASVPLTLHRSAMR